MHAGEILSLIGLNCLILAGFLFFQGRYMERRLRYLKNEILELEDLVAAIIEEFEEVAASVDNQTPSRPEVIQSSSIVADHPPESRSLPAGETSLEKSTEEISQVSATFPGPEVEQKPIQNPTRSQTADPRHARILELWKNGIPIEEIARQLGTGRGEIHLILEIYHQI